MNDQMTPHLDNNPFLMTKPTVDQQIAADIETDAARDVTVMLSWLGWKKATHPQGRSYIEIVTDPEGPEPRKEYWCKS